MIVVYRASFEVVTELEEGVLPSCSPVEATSAIRGEFSAVEVEHRPAAARRAMTTAVALRVLLNRITGWML